MAGYSSGCRFIRGTALEMAPVRLRARSDHNPEQWPSTCRCGDARQWRVRGGTGHRATDKRPRTKQRLPDLVSRRCFEHTQRSAIGECGLVKDHADLTVHPVRRAQLRRAVNGRLRAHSIQVLSQRSGDPMSVTLLADVGVRVLWTRVVERQRTRNSPDWMTSKQNSMDLGPMNPCNYRVNASNRLTLR